jgi:feruloyl esterase
MYNEKEYKMRQRNIIHAIILVLTSTTSAFHCTSSAFQAHLPSRARVAYTRELPDNSTFEVPPSDIAYPTSPQGLKALCAVQINVTSSPSSAFSFGLFLPQDWNHRFLAVGNGGFAGGINWLDMAAGVGYGFASMSTDTGHNSTAGDITWALDQPEKQTDFGWRAMHESVVLAKKVVAAYYGDELKYSYYSGCSTGGRQGLKEVEMFPDDFDGVLAGAPAWWTTHLQTWTIKAGLYNLPVDAAHHIPTSLFNVIGAEVLRQCDPQDGLKDNIIMDPAGCDFFAEALLCGAGVENGTKADCLTPAQIGTLYHIYNDYVETNQTFIFPHLELGSEAQWPFLLGASTPSTYGYEYPQYMLGLGEDWSYWDFNYSIVELADREDPGNCNADDFDLRPFHNNGGKLIMYQGYSDALIPTGSSIYFYKEVLKTLTSRGVDLDPWFRHFLVPGMQHCSGTPPDVNAPWYFAGASQAGLLSTQPGSVHSVPGFEDPKHDILLALMEWTEKGVAPDSVVATKWRNDTLFNEVWKQRPICPYPQQARYVGHGDPDDAENWRCGDLWDLKVQ